MGELGSDGEDVLCLSGSSNADDETPDDQLEFDMWEGQFSLASSLPTSRQSSWYSHSDLLPRQATFDSYLAGNLKDGATLLNGGQSDATLPPARMTRSLQHMPSYVTDTLEERIQSEIDSIFDDLDFNEDTLDILSRNRIQSYAQQAPQSPRSRRKLVRRPSDYQLYYNGLANSTGTLHLSDTEENDEVQILQDQVGQLAESQASTDDRYSKVRQENVSLNQRIHVLEEQLREMDQRSDEKLADEQKRNRELLARMEREKQLEIENYSIRLQSMERDYNSSVREVTQLKSHNDRLKAENNSLEQELFETQQSLSELQKEFQRLQDATKREQDQVAHERQMNEHIVEELSRELETLKSSSFSRGMVAPSMNGDLDLDSSPASLLNGALNSGLNSNHSELEDELKSLRVQNKRLQESNDELEAVLMNRSLEQGKAVLSQTNREGTSIEMELRNMDDNQDFSDIPYNFEEFCQLRTALKEQQEVNSQLRGYIDGILMNIIDKYPELLEVRK